MACKRPIAPNDVVCVCDHHPEVLLCRFCAGVWVPQQGYHLTKLMTDDAKTRIEARVAGDVMYCCRPDFQNLAFNPADCATCGMAAEPRWGSWQRSEVCNLIYHHYGEEVDENTTRKCLKRALCHGCLLAAAGDVRALFLSGKVSLPWSAVAGGLQRLLCLTRRPAWLPYSIECIAQMSKSSEEGLSTLGWASVCAWFGPAINEAFLLRIAWLASRSWFYAGITMDNATELAARHAPGSWLLRFSSSEAGLVFSVRTKSGSVVHYRVSRDWSSSGGNNGEYVLKMGKQAGDYKRFPTLTSLMEGAQRVLYLREAICTSRVGDEVTSTSITGLYKPSELAASRLALLNGPQDSGKFLLSDFM